MGYYQTELKPIDQRLETLKNLIRKLPEKTQRKLLERLKLKEKGSNPSSYLPTLGAEIETFSLHQYNKELPYKEIEEVEKAGIKRDVNDSFPTEDKENKWEVALEPTRGTHILLARELQQLIRRKLVFPHKRKKTGGKEKYQIQDYYPVHVTLGGITRDFPPLMARGDAILFHGRKYFEKDLRTKLRDWTEYKDKDETGWERKFKHSDCFILARLLDATLYATSPDRLRGPFAHWKDGEPIRGYADKGFAGVKDREPTRGGTGMDAIELRTSEMWGEHSFQGFVKYLASAEAVGATLISFQKIPIQTRDRIIELEMEEKPEEAERIVQSFENFTLEHDRELAMHWLHLRREITALFLEYGIPDPSAEYWSVEFMKFADVLEIEEKKMKQGEENLISKTRDLVIRYRSRVNELLNLKEEQS